MRTAFHIVLAAVAVALLAATFGATRVPAFFAGYLCGAVVMAVVAWIRSGGVR